MTRLVLFLSFLVAVVMVMSLGSYNNIKVDNKKFSFKEAQEKHEEKLDTIAKLEQARLDALKPKVVEEAPVDAGPLVVLDTPELQRGSDLFGKCIVCHGKDGSGKKSQNAPHIGGQYDWYIQKQVTAMQSGERINQVMMPYIRTLSAQDIKDLAAYVSKLPWGKK